MELGFFFLLGRFGACTNLVVYGIRQDTERISGYKYVQTPNHMTLVEISSCFYATTLHPSLHLTISLFLGGSWPVQGGIDGFFCDETYFFLMPRALWSDIFLLNPL
jgi:hypothetical protein